MTALTFPLLIPEALYRTRTDDPFLTMDGALSDRVAPGPTGSPCATRSGPPEDPNGPPRRPQDAPTSRALEALEKLLAISRGDWSDPDRVPDGDPPGECDWGYCDDPATAWRWAEDLGGWIPVCAEHAPTRPACPVCGVRLVDAGTTRRGQVWESLECNHLPGAVSAEELRSLAEGHDEAVGR